MDDRRAAPPAWAPVKIGSFFPQNYPLRYFSAIAQPYCSIKWTCWVELTTPATQNTRAQACLRKPARASTLTGGRTRESKPFFEGSLTR